MRNDTTLSLSLSFSPLLVDPQLSVRYYFHSFLSLEEKRETSSSLKDKKRKKKGFEMTRVTKTQGVMNCFCFRVLHLSSLSLLTLVTSALNYTLLKTWASLSNFRSFLSAYSQSLSIFSFSVSLTNYL